MKHWFKYCLKKSNVEKDTPFTFVRYEPTRAVVLNRERTGGVRENFLKSTVDYYNKSPFVEGVRVSS